MTSLLKSTFIQLLEVLGIIGLLQLGSHDQIFLENFYIMGYQG